MIKSLDALIGCIILSIVLLAATAALALTFLDMWEYAEAIDLVGMALFCAFVASLAGAAIGGTWAVIERIRARG